MNMNKKDVIKVLEMIAIHMEIKGENTFKISAYRKAAQALETDDRSLSDIEDVSKLKGIGKGTASVIDELMVTGSSQLLEQLKAEVPSGLLKLLKVQGLGGKKIAKLYQELGITDIESLIKACNEHKVQELAGFGKKTEEKILLAAKEMGSRPERLPIAFMLPIAEQIELQLEEMNGIRQWSRAGSLRRLRETIKDLDFIIATEEPVVVREQLLKLEHISSVIASGDTKVSVVLEYDYEVSVDFRLVEPSAFATTLHHFTGSKDHNIRMRQIAKSRGEKISEYGVEVEATGEMLTFDNEQDFFQHFDLHYIPPELRQGNGEVEKFTESHELIDFRDIQGDLHMHTTWSDGAYSIEEMIEAARERGYSYIAITDHSKYLKVANGLSDARLLQQNEEIKLINEKYDDITVLSGVEMDILPDGTLDYGNEVLAQLDIVIASIHSSFSQPREIIMDRLIHALENKHVDLIAHPTGRLIGRREGYDVDLDMLIQVAARTNTALELNANPNRLDLSAEWLVKAQEAGVKLVINTDAHSIDMLDDMKVGISAARAGWVRRDSVINTWDLAMLKQFLSRND
ncbi:DNA polymerase/3'-5' exonuclease PolX [Bacillus solimangrovi]|uniref:DNA polymerase beta n=1 Tax=Bacillus solimangrovi TaxID=1305675 RepID=A0A1E5LCV6_9BACI|nr:DNA polymerase/3'-5' exonuclease PolX [Bacillus solimangrovi]OEH91890.1 hypothetical protein BFG57_03910 [Bacillus solimangrovi]